MFVDYVGKGGVGTPHAQESAWWLRKATASEGGRYKGGLEAEGFFQVDLDHG